MSTRRLVVGITFLAVFAMAVRISMDTDTWWHLRAGQWIWTHKSIPQIDLFSYTRYGAAWQYPGWLVEVPMFAIFRRFGPGGLNVWTAGMVTLTFVFIWRSLSGGVFTRAFVVVLAAATTGIYWAARPHLVTFLLAAAFFWILEDFRWKKKDRLWVLLPLMVVWANSHGGFAVGFMLWGVYLFDALTRFASRALNRSPSKGQDPELHRVDGLSGEIRRLLLTGGLLALAVCVNPSGPAMLLYPFKTISIGALRDYIQEWQSPDFHSLSVQPFLWLLILTLGAIGFSRRRMAVSDFLLVSGFAYLAFMAGRNIALFGVVSPAVLTRHAEPSLSAWKRHVGLRASAMGLDRTPRKLQVVNGLVFSILALATVLKAGLVYPEEVNWEHFRETLPVEASEYLQVERPEGRLFNSYNWGGYLLWALPEYPVFIDGRTDLYNDEVIAEWFQTVRVESGWEQVLDRWGVNLVMLEPSMPLLGALSEAGWHQAYSDDLVVLYER